MPADSAGNAAAFDSAGAAGRADAVFDVRSERCDVAVAARATPRPDAGNVKEEEDEDAIRFEGDECGRVVFESCALGASSPPSSDPFMTPSPTKLVVVAAASERCPRPRPRPAVDMIPRIDLCVRQLQPPLGTNATNALQILIAAVRNVI